MYLEQKGLAYSSIYKRVSEIVERYSDDDDSNAVYRPKPVIYTALMLEDSPVKAALQKSLNKSKQLLKQNMALLKGVYKREDL